MTRRICERFGVEPESALRHHFYLEDRFGVPKKEISAFVHSPDMFGDPEFWLSSEAFQANIDYVKRWHNSYVTDKIFIVTGRNNDVREPTQQWLDNNDVPFDALFMDTLHEKVNVMRYVNADFIVEDRYEEVYEVAKKKRKAYILEREYNVINKDKPVQGRYAENIIWVSGFMGIEENEGIR